MDAAEHGALPCTGCSCHYHTRPGRAVRHRIPGRCLICGLAFPDEPSFIEHVRRVHHRRAHV